MDLDVVAAGDGSARVGRTEGERRPAPRSREFPTTRVTSSTNSTPPSLPFDSSNRNSSPRSSSWHSSSWVAGDPASLRHLLPSSPTAGGRRVRPASSVGEEEGLRPPEGASGRAGPSEESSPSFAAGAAGSSAGIQSAKFQSSICMDVVAPVGASVVPACGEMARRRCPSLLRREKNEGPAGCARLFAFGFCEFEPSAVVHAVRDTVLNVICSLMAVPWLLSPTVAPPLLWLFSPTVAPPPQLCVWAGLLWLWLLTLLPPMPLPELSLPPLLPPPIVVALVLPVVEACFLSKVSLTDGESTGMDADPPVTPPPLPDL